MKHWLRIQKKYISSYFIRPRQVAWFYAFAVFLGLFVSWWYVGTVIEERLARDEREQVAIQVDRIGASLALAVNQRLVLVTSVRSYMEAKIRRDGDIYFDHNVNIDDTNYFVSSLFSSTAGIRNIAIAPGGVMLYVFPYEENKTVLGYEPALDERPNVREEVQRAIETGEIILSLPYELIQGGQGLIARQAIYVEKNYWGLANVVLDVPPLLQEAGITPAPEGLELALKDQSGKVFFGSKEVFNLAPVSYKIELPEGSWELVGIPKVGWHTNFRATILSYRWMGLTGIIAITLLVYQLINRRDRLANLVDLRTHELSLSNQTLITVLEGIDADVYVSEFETNEILFANKHIRNSFNDELIGRTCFKVFRNESSKCEHCKNKLLLDANENPTGVHLWECRNPITDRWYKNADRAIRWHDGRYVHLQIATDITEQKQAVEAIRENEERYRNLFDSLPVGVYRSTPEGRFLDGNPALIEMLGYPDQETMLTANIKDLYIKEAYREQELALIEQNDSVSNYRMKLRRYDGSIIWVQDSSNAVRDSLGNTIHYYGLLEDITERVRAEDAARAYQDRFRVFFNSVNDAIFVHPLMEEGFAPFVEVNDVACQRYGYSREEFLKIKATDITLDTDVKEHSARENREKLLKARHLVFETVHIKKSGETFPVEINANILEENGQPVILAVVRDITQRKQAEEKFKVVFDSAPDAHYIYDLNGRFVDGNEMVEEMLGYRKDELVGKTYLEVNFFLESQILQITAILEKNILGKSTGPDEFTLIPKNGGKIEVEVVTHPVVIDGETLVLGIARDITERKQAELAVIESEERYRNIVEASLLGMHMYEFQSPGRLVFTGSNSAADTILGVDNSIFVGKTIEEAFPALAGTEVPDRYKSAAKNGVPWRTEQFNYDADGIVGVFEVVAFQTSPNNMVAMFQDVTARKKAENALHTKTAELEALFSISAHLRTAQSADEMIPLVLTEMRRVLGSDAHAVIMLDANEKSFTYLLGDGTLAASTGVQFIIENSISGIVLKTRQPYITDDLSADQNKTINLKGFQDLGPAAFVPVISESVFMGVLVCARTKTDRFHPYSPSEIQLLSAIGEMVGNAFRRATLYDQAMKRLQHVQALHSIDMAISANLDLSVILDVLLTQGTAQLDADAASLLLLNPHTHMLEFGAGSGFRKEEINSTRLRLGEGLPGQVAMDRNVLHLSNLANAENLVRRYLLDDGFVSYQAAPLIAKGQLQGVLEIFHRKAIVVRDEQADFLETLATQAAIAIDNSQLFSDLQRSNFELEMAYDATIEGWSRALELRDQETEGHTLRVTDMTLQLAQAMGVRSSDLIHIRRGALLHDIGKMGVPDHILLKPGKLNDAEWQIMRQHAVYAFEMLWPIEFLRFALDIPHYHHERWNGSGYPRGLKEEQIPLSARIFAVVDVWDALNNDRPYRKAWTEEKALDYITSNAGKLFDPHVVKYFLDFLKNNEEL